MSRGAATAILWLARLVWALSRVALVFFGALLFLAALAVVSILVNC